MNAETAARWGAVVWPAFLAAAALNALIFSLVDPQQLHGLGTAQPLGWADTTVYTVGFFVCWALMAGASAVTQWLAGGGSTAGGRLR
jgi:hypothetical protein